jgi:hypothetical protein
VYVQFYRHECPEQQGRTRSFPLKDLTYTSPELWVTWADGEMRVISPQEAEDLVAAGEVVEFETVLAGQFSFTWKQGECRFCHLVAVSTDSILKDARPLKAALSGDLASFTQEQSFRVTKGVSREHE